MNQPDQSSELKIDSFKNIKKTSLLSINENVDSKSKTSSKNNDTNLKSPTEISSNQTKDEVGLNLEKLI